jgi:hypothetical protein
MIAYADRTRASEELDFHDSCDGWVLIRTVVLSEPLMKRSQSVNVVSERRDDRKIYIGAEWV